MDGGELISVIVPVYNVDKYLEKCIQSIIDQTYTDLELILVDDGSTDMSGKICDEYSMKDSRIRVIHKENGGASSAKNAGLEICKGDYVSFIDADDYIEERMLELMLLAIKEYKTDFAVCEINHITTDGGKRIRKIWRDMHSKPIYGDALYADILCRSAVLCNKLFVRKVIQGVRFNTKYTYGEDTMFLIEALDKLSSAVAVDYNGYNYLTNREGNVVSAPINKNAFNFLEFIRDAHDILWKRGMKKAAFIRMFITLQEALKKVPLDDIKGYKKYIIECKKTAEKIKWKDLYSPDIFSGHGKKRVLIFSVIRFDPVLYLKLKKAGII